MRFEWDEAKRRSNLSKHGLDLGHVREVFDGFFVDELDLRQDYGEDRHVILGLLAGYVVQAVVTRPEDDVTRVISFRRATKKEEVYFEQRFADRLGPTPGHEG